MLGVPRRLGAFLMASGISAIGAAIFWIFDIWELWNHAVTAVNIALLFFTFFVLIAMREVWNSMEAVKFSIEPNWQQSQQCVWHHHVEKDKEYFELRTAIKLRFNNGDIVPHVVKTAELILLCPWWHWWSRKLANSYYVSLYSKDTHPMGRFDLSGPGIKVQPHSMTEYIYFRFSTELPLGISSLKHHVARLRFEILGRREKILSMSVRCPRPHEFFNYDSDARPLVADTTQTPNEPNE